MSKSNNPLISIIVPVYNISKYLERCVNSIIEQSYKNIEIILVDDGRNR
jgi:glycosyltransferase involved in cell wall biosynthesis